MRNKLLAVVGAALLVGLLTIGTVTIAGPPGPPPKPEPPQPQPQITDQQIIDGVNQLSRVAKLADELLLPNSQPWLNLGRTPTNRIPSTHAVMPVIPREGVRLGACRSLDDGSFLFPAGRAAVTRLGIIELAREYKLGGPLKQGLYGIIGLYDPNNELDAKFDPKNEIDTYLALMPITDGEIDTKNIVAAIGLPHKELDRVLLGVKLPPELLDEFGVLVLLNLVVALLE